VAEGQSAWRADDLLKRHATTEARLKKAEVIRDGSVLAGRSFGLNRLTRTRNDGNWHGASRTLLRRLISNVPVLGMYRVGLEREALKARQHAGNGVGE
jgi:hypothetical protein